MTVTHPELIPIATDIPPTPTNTPTPTPLPPTSSTSPAINCVGSLPRIAPENRCSPYNSNDYPYPPSVEPRIVAQMGGRIYGPYSGTYFASIRETDIEHIVARSEAHDSGLCSATAATRRSFSSDLLNLTLASPSLNRYQKVAYDLAEWLPAMNVCWYVNRVVEVKLKYGLTMDSAEAQKALEVLNSCGSCALQFTALPAPAQAPVQPAPQRCPRNCTEAHEMGMSNMRSDHACYQPKFDRDRDGIGCER